MKSQGVPGPLSMNCLICSTKNPIAFTATLAGKYKASYYSCSNCGCVHTEKPYWLPEVYRDALNDEDTYVLQRNLHFAKIVSSVIVSLFNPRGRFLDFGSAHGVFPRLMRDKGFDYYWQDGYAKNLFCRGFEYTKDTGAIELISAMECFEHFDKPMAELKTMLAISKNIFFTTDLLPATVPMPADWYYYGLTHGQHITFYSQKTLVYMANSIGCYVYTNGFNIHLFTQKKLSQGAFQRIVKPNFLLYLRIKKLLKSRTQSDHDLIVNKKLGIF